MKYVLTCCVIFWNKLCKTNKIHNKPKTKETIFLGKTHEQSNKHKVKLIVEGRHKKIDKDS